jgi:uncharacterized protein (UPF0332 family)
VDLETKRAYIRVRLMKAHEDLVAARDNLALGHRRVAVNRAYYAVFHSASAALLWLDVERAKHSGVQSAFNRFLIKPGLIEEEYGQIYRVARIWREEQDYSYQSRPLDQPSAAQIVGEAERFVARLERYLREAGAIE